MLELFVSYSFLAFGVIAILHRTKWWPPSAWIRWLCIFIAGPLTWGIFALLWLESKCH